MKDIARLLQKELRKYHDVVETMTDIDLSKSINGMIFQVTGNDFFINADKFDEIKKVVKDLGDEYGFEVVAIDFEVFRFNEKEMVLNYTIITRLK